MKKTTTAQRARPASHLALAALALAAATGCQPASDASKVSTYKDYLYMTEYKGGHVYYLDPATGIASSTSLATSFMNAGEIAFYKGLGYVAVGMGSDEGVCRFDPSAANPSFTKLAGTVAAQYFAFHSATKAYVSSYGDGIYSFDPSSPGTGLSASPIAGTAGLTVQELVLAGGYLYAADNGHGAILRIDPADDSLKATIAATAAGTTGLAAGSYKGVAGVFAANTGGSIDFVAHDSGTATAVVSTSLTSPIYPGALVQLPGGDLIASGYDPSYVNHTYSVTLSGPSPAVVEILDGTKSFGNTELAYKDGLVYIPFLDYVDGSNYLYTIHADGSQASYSPLKVMAQTTDGIARIAFFED